MPVTSADVLHVAALARLRLAPEEIERLTSQLNDILGHVAELAAADTDQVQPEPATTWPAPLRDDASAPDPLALPPAELAPAWQEGFFTVPRLAAMEIPPESAP
ncbi:MAG TPA: Asp-tRNA(Asn)/Glu-tRNA(Gln) amidotransferase subunit GatC [Longimicrobiales bacterium]